jgi:hypothetical protein
MTDRLPELKQLLRNFLNQSSKDEREQCAHLVILVAWAVQEIERLRK